MQLVALIFVIISLASVIMVPSSFSKLFCVWEMTTFLIFGTLYLWHKIRRNGLVCFDLFFIPTFFIVNYAHAVFIYPEDDFLPAFQFSTNKDIIPYAISVAQMAIAMYMLGSVFFERKDSDRNAAKIRVPEMTVNRSAYVSFGVSLAVFIYVFLSNQIQSGVTHLYPRLMVMILSLIGLSWYYQAQQLGENERGVRTLFGRNKLNIVSTVAFTLSQLFIGSRSEVLFLLLMVLLIINSYYIRVRMKYLLPVIVMGVVAMGFLMITRVTSYNLVEASFAEFISYGMEVLEESPEAGWLLLTDLLVNAKTLYDGVDYTQVYGFLYGRSYIPYLFVFIPFGGSFFTRMLTGLDMDSIHTGYILTDFAQADYGLGTNMIGDLYMNLSLVGVIVLLFILGGIVAKVEVPRSRYQFFILMALFANGIYLVRADIFSWITFLVFFVIFDWILRLHISVDEETGGEMERRSV